MRTPRIFFLLAAVTLAVLVSVPAAWAAWTGTVADTQISFDDNEYASYVRLAVDGNGVIHVVWSEDDPLYDEIHYGSSTDGGATWSCSTADRLISFNDGEGVFDTCEIAIDSQNNIFVVWSEDEPEPSGQNEIMLSYSTDGGATWSGSAADVVISDPLQDDTSNYPTVVADLNDTIHVVYNKTEAVSGAAKIHTTRSTDGGVTWSAVSGGDQVITSTANNYADSNADIGVDSSGTLWVSYKKYLGTGVGSQMYITKSTDGGVTWSGTTAETAISTLFNIASLPQICVDSSDNIHVVWYASDETASPYHYEAYHTHSTDGGVTWSGNSGPQMISYESGTDDNSAFYPKIAADHCGNVTVAWDEQPIGVGTTEIMVSQSTDGGATWSGATADELISFPDGENGYRPDVATMADGSWVAVWNEFNGTTSDNYEVHLSMGDKLCTFSTLGCDYTISPSSGTLPFAVNMSVSLDNLYTDQVRQMAARINVLLGNGTYFSSWRAGFTNIQPESTFSRTWVQNLPALITLVGTNTFTLAAVDVTPAPFNQPPYPASGDTCSSVQTVEAFAP
jgi:hypothetical protein